MDWFHWDGHTSFVWRVLRIEVTPMAILDRLLEGPFLIAQAYRHYQFLVESPNGPTITSRFRPEEIAEVTVAGVLSSG